VVPTIYYLGDQIKENEMDGPCVTYREKRERHTGFWWGNLNDTGIDGRIILTWILKKEYGKT